MYKEDLRKILECTISEYPKKLTDPMPKVMAKLDDGTEKMLFTFYPDEISFFSDEFLGLTVEQAYDLWRKRDLAYLRG